MLIGLKEGQNPRLFKSYVSVITDSPYVILHGFPRVALAFRERHSCSAEALAEEQMPCIVSASKKTLYYINSPSRYP